MFDMRVVRVFLLRSLPMQHVECLNFVFGFPKFLIFFQGVFTSRDTVTCMATGLTEGGGWPQSGRRLRNVDLSIIRRLKCFGRI